MKLTTQPKKPKKALSIVSNKKMKPKKPVKDSVNLKNAAVLEFARESLKTPDRKKLTNALKTKNLLPKSSPKTLKNDSLTPKALKTKSNLSKSTPKTLKKDILTPKKVAKTSGQGPSPKPTTLTESPKDDLKVMRKRKMSLNASVSDVSFTKASPLMKGTPKKRKSIEAASAKEQEDEPAQDEDEDEDGVEGKPHNETPKTVKISSLNQQLLKGVCDATLKLIKSQENSRKNKDLFGSEPQPIHLQVNLSRVAKDFFRIIRSKVPNSVLPQDPDVCLVVPDLFRGMRRDVTLEKYQEMFQNRLERTGTKGITQLLPFTMLRAQYSEFEMKRRLAKSFDVFLCDGRIHGHCLHFLGKIFENAKKTPIPIRAVNRKKDKSVVFSDNLQQEIDDALHKVSVVVHSSGNSFSIPVGHSQFSQEELAANVDAVWSTLEEQLPGGVENIRTAFLKPKFTSPVPLFASLAAPSGVPVPKLKPKPQPVEDELSTMPGYRVTVNPDGAVVLHDSRSKEDIEFSKVVLDDLAQIKARKNHHRSKGKKKNEGKGDETKAASDDEADSATDAEDDNDVDDDNDLDDDSKNNTDKDDNDFKNIEDAEAMYLSQWSDSAALMEQEEAEKEKQEPKNNKQQKKVEKSASKVIGNQLSKKKGISKKFTGGGNQNVTKNAKKRSRNLKTTNNRRK